MKPLLFLFCYLCLGHAQTDRLLLLDDFSGQQAPWLFHRDGSVKQDGDAIQTGNGYLNIRLRNPDGGRECNVGISNPQPIYTKNQRQLTVEIRVRFLNPMLPGSRGFGFWKTAKNGKADNLAWFMQQFLPGAPKLSWARFGSLYKRQAKWQDYVPVAGEWHTYKIVRDLLLGTTKYFIDGLPVFNTPGIAARGRMAFHLWIDNQVYSRSKGIKRLGWKGESGMVVDYVMIYDGPAPGRSFPAEGSIKLNEQPRFFFDGSSHIIPPVYTVENLNGPVWLIADVTAEQMAGLANPDFLKLSVHGNSGNGSLSWKGNAQTLQAFQLPDTKTLNIDFEYRGTPFLNRLLLLSSPSGKMLLNDPYQQGKQLKFTSTGTKLICLVATEKPVPGKLILDSGSRHSPEIELYGDTRLSVQRFEIRPGRHELKIDFTQSVKVERVFLYQE